MKSVGLIGFGRFGQLLFEQLSESCNISIYDPEKENMMADSGIPFRDLETVCRNPLIILAVPVKHLEDIAVRMAPLVSGNSVIMDVCAVKKYPLSILEKCLAPDIQILGSHPLFGPDSVKENMREHLMIICPVRINQESLQNVKNFWDDFGIQLIEMTPDEQDRLMAWTLAMTHFLGRSLAELPLPDTTIATRDYQNLIHLMKKINRDTWDLFEDMHRFNPYTKEMREAIVGTMDRLKKQLDKSQIS
jgi:prephenate dehydrogenase